MGFIRQHQVVALQDVAGMDAAAMQQLLSPTHSLRWEAPQRTCTGQGVAFAVASNIAPLCTLKSVAAHGGLAWLECSGRLFSRPTPVHVANVYLPPVGQRHSLREFEQRLEELQQQTAEYGVAGPHIWMGDFNADLWGASELPEEGFDLLQTVHHAPELHRQREVRGAPPKGIKAQAKTLLNTAAATGSLFLTGRKGDDGAATFCAATGQSRVDHVALHYTLWGVVVGCGVLPTTTILSDHRPIHVALCPPAEGNIDVGPPHGAVPRGESRLAWRQDRAEEYARGLASDTAGLQQLDQAIEAGDDDAAVEALRAVIWGAAANCGMVCRPRAQGGGGQRQQRPSWWNSEVQAAHSALRDASLQAAPGPVRKAARQRFKATARRLRRRHNRHVAAAVADRLAKHERTVYRERLAEPRQRCPATAVSAAAWEEHMRQQFSAAAAPGAGATAGGAPTEGRATQPMEGAGTAGDQGQPEGLGISAQKLEECFNQAFSRMRVHTAAGLDGFAAPFIKLAALGSEQECGHPHVLQSRLRKWFTGMMGRAGMPAAWQPVRIQPIYKKGDPLDPNNYRPIAITSVLYRLYASMVTAATDRWAAQHGHIPPEQFGFQRRRSTTQAAFVLRHATNAARATGHCGKLHCAFVDFAKAYDSVSHELLWEHLRLRLHMPEGLLAAIQKLYHGAVYELHDGHKRTARVPCMRGIKQGCPLSPLLFSLYISDLPSTMQEQCPAEGVECGGRRLRCLIYADDLSLLAGSPGGLQRMLDALHTYAAGKRLAVNVSKTEVMVFGARRGVQRATQTQYTYGPGREQLRQVSEFKFLGLQQVESGSMRQPMEARAAAFAGALQGTGRTAARVRLGRHVPTRIKLAAVYAVPVANYGDVVWGTAQLQPKASLANPVQQAMLTHLKEVAGAPASTPGWPLLNELGIQPLQRGWWQHIVRFYNAAVSPAGRQLSPIMSAALTADMQLAQRGKGAGGWSAQLLDALATLEEGSAQPILQQAAKSLQPLPGAKVMQLVDAAYEQQRWAGTGNPRDPGTQHRVAATYHAWFSGTAGKLLEYAKGRTGSRACAQLRTNLRVRLGAVRTPVNLGRRSHTPFQERCCPACAGRGEGAHVGDALHVFFQCGEVQEQLGERWGWEGPPGGATDFGQLYSGDLKRAVAYVADVEELLAASV